MVLAGTSRLSLALCTALLDLLQSLNLHIELEIVPGSMEYHESLPANLAALLAAMFIDQMPGNVPTLTKASGQRLLGRITPGSAAAWRKLLINMNDTESPTMRLKDAV